MSETVKLILQRHADFTGTRKNHPGEPWDPWEVSEALRIMDELAAIVRDGRPDIVDEIAALLRETHAPDIWGQPWPPGLRERIQGIEVVLLDGVVRAAPREPSPEAIRAATEWLRAVTPRNMTQAGYENWARRVLEAAYAADPREPK